MLAAGSRLFLSRWAQYFTPERLFSDSSVGVEISFRFSVSVDLRGAATRGTGSSTSMAIKSLVPTCLQGTELLLRRPEVCHQRLQVVLDRLRNLSFVAGGILLLQPLHVLQRVVSQDADPESQHRSPHQHLCPPQECTRNILLIPTFILLLVLGMVLLAISLFVSLESLVNAELHEGSPGSEESSQVSGTVVLRHCFGILTVKLFGCCLYHDLVPEDDCAGNLRSELSVCEVNCETVLLELVLVVRLLDHLLTCVEVSIALSTEPLLDWVSEIPPHYGSSSWCHHVHHHFDDELQAVHQSIGLITST